MELHDLILAAAEKCIPNPDTRIHVCEMLEYCNATVTGMVNSHRAQLDNADTTFTAAHDRLQATRPFVSTIAMAQHKHMATKADKFQ